MYFLMGCLIGALSLTIYLQIFQIIFLTIIPNPPCKRFLWDETGEPAENHDFRQSVDELFSRAIRCSI